MQPFIPFISTFRAVTVWFFFSSRNNWVKINVLLYITYYSLNCSFSPYGPVLTSVSNSLLSCLNCIFLHNAWLKLWVVIKGNLLQIRQRERKTVCVVFNQLGSWKPLSKTRGCFCSLIPSKILSVSQNIAIGLLPKLTVYIVIIFDSIFALFICKLIFLKLHQSVTERACPLVDVYVYCMFYKITQSICIWEQSYVSIWSF